MQVYRQEGTQYIQIRNPRKWIGDSDVKKDKIDQFYSDYRRTSETFIPHATSKFDACPVRTFVRPLQSFFTFPSIHHLPLSSPDVFSPPFNPSRPPIRSLPAIERTVLDFSSSMARFIFIPCDSFDWTWLVVTGPAIYFRYCESTFRPRSHESFVFFACIVPVRLLAIRLGKIRTVLFGIIVASGEFVVHRWTSKITAHGPVRFQELVRAGSEEMEWAVWM